MGVGFLLRIPLPLGLVCMGIIKNFFKLGDYITMNKTDLVKRIVEVSTEEISQKQVNSMLSALETVVKDAVYNYDEVNIPGIGRVKSKVVPERSGIIMMGANKGEKWVKPEHRAATIKIASSLKRMFD